MLENYAQQFSKENEENSLSQIKAYKKLENSQYQAKWF